MKILYKPLFLIGSAGALCINACDSADPESKNFNFDNSRFSTTELADSAATAKMPLFLLDGDEIVLTPSGATTSHDESVAAEMNRYGASLFATGLNVVTFERYQDPTLQNRFPALQANWVAGEGSVTAVLTSVDSIDQTEIDDFTKFAANNSTSGGVFSNPFVDANGDLDGEISAALAQGGLDNVNISEAKGNLIEQEFKAIGKEIYNNADFSAHLHNTPVPYAFPIMRATMRRVFTFTATSTNGEILSNGEISGNYTVQEQYRHLYTHNHLDDDDFIRMVIQPQSGTFSGTETVETGSFTIKLQ